MLQLGSIRGTRITVDLSFLILVALFVASSYNPRAGIKYSLLWIPVLFLSVLIHELAHAAVIGMFGYGPSEIVLGGIGGATMNQRKAKHWHNVLISLAGPLASFALAYGIAYLMAYVPFTRRDPMLVEFLPLLIFMNLFWAKFNLIPISPLDGGHAVRDFLRIFMTDRKGFPIAVWIGIVSGIAVVIWAARARQIFIAVLIAWYVYLNYQQWQYYREHGLPGD
jgi:stage IV sporulation protein FB